MHLPTLVLLALPLVWAGPARLIERQNGAAAGPTCPAGEPISCPAPDPATVDSCCVNVPGGAMAQTQFWQVLPFRV